MASGHDTQHFSFRLTVKRNKHQANQDKLAQAALENIALTCAQALQLTINTTFPTFHWHSHVLPPFHPNPLCTFLLLQSTHQTTLLLAFQAFLLHSSYLLSKRVSINVVNHTIESAKMQFAANFLFNATAEIVIAHMKDGACTWKDDFRSFPTFLEDGWADLTSDRTATTKLET